MWLNLFLLLALSFFPFSAALLGERPNVQSAVTVYGANVIAAGGALLVQWHYARTSRLLIETRPPALDRVVYRRMWAGQLAYWVALVVRWR